HGMALMALGRHDDALASFDQGLEVAPRNRSLLYGLGCSLLALGRAEEALAAFDKSLAITPSQPDVLTQRAAALRALGHHADAAGSDQRSLTAVSAGADAHLVRGISLWELEKHAEALASYEKAAACDDPRALSKLASGRLMVADWARAGELADALRRSIAAGNFVDAVTTLAFGFEPSLRLAAAKNCIRVFSPVAKPAFVHSRPDKVERLRIAYLSSDFRRHPVGAAVVELLERHDKTRFEIIGVSHGPNDASDTRARIAKAFGRFHEVAS